MSQGNGNLSEIQQEMLHAIERHTAERGRPPTVREIGAAVGIRSPGHTSYHLRHLEDLGYITREGRTSRGISVVHRQGIEVLGAIAAGEPLEIYSADQRETLQVEHRIGFDGTAGYALCVKGDSMIEEGILDGDYVLVRPTKEARNGDLVVAVHLTANGERGAATLKRFFREAGQKHVRLQPSNQHLQPILVPARQWDTQWEVQGAVVALYRDYRRERPRT